MRNILKGYKIIAKVYYALVIKGETMYNDNG